MQQVVQSLLSTKIIISICSNEKIIRKNNAIFILEESPDLLLFKWAVILFLEKKCCKKNLDAFFLTIANKYPFCLSEVCFIFRFVSYPTPPSRFEPPPSLAFSIDPTLVSTGVRKKNSLATLEVDVDAIGIDFLFSFYSVI